MMLDKLIDRFPILSAALFFILTCALHPGATATPGPNRASQELQSSLGMQSIKAVGQIVQKPMSEELDTFFATSKTAFDKMAASPVLKSPRIVPVNSFFMQSLKAHLPWHSMIKADKLGAVVNEVIRIEGVSAEKHSVANQRWFRQVSRTMKEYTELTKMEKTGRFYLIWAAPIVVKVKGTDTFGGGVATQIDLWDCFDWFADKSNTPFMVRILGRVTLYNHLWSDTIKYVEKPLSVSGIDKIVVRYPAISSEAVAARAADSMASALARLDSIRIRTASELVVKAAIAKKASDRNIAIITAVVIVLLVIIVGLILLLMSRGRMHDPPAEGKGRFDNL